jgi:hypothetical protein
MAPTGNLVNEVREYLDPQVPKSLQRGELTLRPYRLPAMKAVQEETHTLLSIELEGSGSLNRRGTQLAASCGVILGLLANASRAWTSTESPDALVFMTMLAALPLASAAGCALWAVTPQSKWRGELYALVVELVEGTPADLDVTSKPLEVGEREELAVRRQATRRLAGMLEWQRETNETKAHRMRWAYLLFAVGVLLTVIEVILLPVLLP